MTTTGVATSLLADGSKLTPYCNFISWRRGILCFILTSNNAASVVQKVRRYAIRYWAISKIHSPTHPAGNVQWSDQSECPTTPQTRRCTTAWNIYVNMNTNIAQGSAAKYIWSVVGPWWPLVFIDKSTPQSVKECWESVMIRGLFRGLLCPPPWGEKIIPIFNVKKNHANTWTLLKMFVWLAIAGLCRGLGLLMAYGNKIIIIIG